MVYILLGAGFEETEALVPLDLLRRAGIPTMTVGIGSKIVYGGHNIGLEADCLLEEMDLTNLDMIVLPGGLGGVATVRGSQPGKTISLLPRSAQDLLCWQTWALQTARTLPAIPAVKAVWVAPI